MIRKLVIKKKGPSLLREEPMVSISGELNKRPLCLQLLVP